MTLNEIADLIISPTTERVSHGNYLNRRGIRGYYLQVRSGNHWCKISVSHADRHAARLTIGELDQIDPRTCELSVIVPAESISAALKSNDAENASVNTYVNSSAVEGIWAEFYHAGNWYMVSLSHVEVPVYARPEELERITDEFLRQQGQKWHGRGKSYR